jgi:hypothetical protein
LAELAKANLYAVQFLDSTRGWVAGDRGAFFGTSNGGSLWTPTQPAVKGTGESSFRSISFSDSKTGCLLPERSYYVLCTEHGGIDWQRVHPSFNSILVSEILDAEILTAHISGKQFFCLYRFPKRAATLLVKTRGGFKDEEWVIPADLTRRLYVFENGRALVIGDNGIIFEVRTGEPKSVARPIAFPAHVDLLAIDGAATRFAWIVGRGGAIFSSTDAGLNWRPQTSGVTTDLDAVAFADERTGWAAGKDGTILATLDGGATWIRQSRPLAAGGAAAGPDPSHPGMLPAPWYYLSLLLVALVLAPALRPPLPVEEPEPSVADLLISDRPLESGDTDAFDFTAVARGLSRFLRNEKTQPPLTLAVTGEWGSGKSSLMNLLRADLKRYGFRPVWFNAWHHQKEQHLLASLLEAVRAQAIPPLWRLEGISYRWRLLRTRWGRYWPVMLVLSLLFAVSAGYLMSHRQQLLDLPPSSADWVTAIKSLGDPAKHGSEFAFLASFAGLATALWKGAKGFGVNPASLLARASSRSRIRDLEALTGFRQRFAAEFRDVTSALNPRTMLILIDDLDRCKPDLVLEVLEAVNFLVSSGDCFVVMGMDRWRVVRCVGLSFKDVADALLDPAAPEAVDAFSREQGARRRQIEFAQQYLEKLINIEVPVPVPSADQSEKLIAAVEPPQTREALSQRRSTAVRAGLRRTLPLVAASALLLLAFWYGFARIGPSSTQSAGWKGSGGSTIARPSAKDAFVAGPTAYGGVRPAPNAAAPARAISVIQGEPVEPHTRLLLLLLVALLGLGLWRLSIRPEIEIRDSHEFEQALAAWHPLVFAKRNTPRSVKRFVNRVRYLAMLQRRDLRDVTFQDRLASWFRRRLGRYAPPTAEQRESPIPEHILVALSAIEFCREEWLRDDRLLHDFAGFLSQQDIPATLKESLADSRWRFSLEKYRAEYLRMSEGVHVS